MRDYGNTNAAPYASAPAVGLAGDTYWNTTTKTLYVSDGTAWIATNYWTDSGTALTPTTAGRVLAIPGSATTGTALTAGTRTIKGRIVAHTSSDAAFLMCNRDMSGVDDAARPAWHIGMNIIADQAYIGRAAAGAGVTSTNLLTIDGAQGKSYFVGVDPQLGITRTGGTACRLDLGEDTNGDCYITTNHPWGPQDSTKPSYMIKLAASIGVCSFFLRLANAAAGAATEVLRMGGGDLTISGATATKASGTAWANPSDERQKRNIVDYGAGLDAIRQLRPVSFEFNGEYGSQDTGQICYGLIAQEVELVMPECVGEREWRPIDNPGADPVTVKTLDQSNMTLALINAVKELATRLAAVEAKHDVGQTSKA